MSLAKPLNVKESVKELNGLRKGTTGTINKRLLMLIEIKKTPGHAIPKRDLSKMIGCDANSITAWKKLYIEKGIGAMMSDGRIGFRPSAVTEQEHKKIGGKLNDAHNAPRGYVELLDWVRTELNKEMKYITLVKYAQRHFGAKIKVARKSHVKKDEAAVGAFKKTLAKSARK